MGHVFPGVIVLLVCYKHGAQRRHVKRAYVVRHILRWVFFFRMEGLAWLLQDG